MIFCNTKRTFFYESHMIYHNNTNDIIRPYIITYMVGYEITVFIVFFRGTEWQSLPN